MKRPTWWVLTTIILAASGVWIWLSIPSPNQANQMQQSIPAVGFLAPNFELVTIQGESISLEDYRGTPVVINFWASWCPPCRAEMPSLEKISLENRGELFILAVNATHDDAIDSVYDFVKRNNLTFPILLDQSGEVNRLYQIKSLPTTYFIDKNGMIQDIVIGGPMSEALIISKIGHLNDEDPN